MNSQKKRFTFGKFDTRKSGFSSRMKIIFVLENRLDERKGRVDVPFYFIFCFLLLFVRSFGFIKS